MKVIFSKSELIEALTPALGAISPKRENSILECLKIKADQNGVHIYSYDNEKGYNIDVNAEVIREGSCLVNAQRFYGMVRNMPSDITFECEENMMAALTSERSRYDIQYLDSKLYPNTPEINARQSFTLTQGQLKDIINQTSFAIGENNMRLQLNGAYFVVDNGYIRVVALDGLRFAERYLEGDIVKENIDVALDTEVRFIIPKKSLAEVVKLLEEPDEKITVVKARRHVMFRVKNVTFYTSTIDGEYIEYSRFIPKNETTVAIANVADIRDSLERALFITEFKESGRMKSPVKLTFDGNILAVSSVSSTNRVYDEIPVVKEGKELEIGFNCKMLLDTFRILDCEKVKLKLTTPLSAMVMAPVDDDDKSFFYFTFPVKITETF